MSDPTDLQTAALEALREAIDGLREDVRAERRGRRTTQVLGALVAVAALTVASVLGFNYLQAGRTTCAEKRARAAVADQRVLLAIDRVAAGPYVRMPASDRRVLAEGISKDLEKLPAPC